MVFWKKKKKEKDPSVNESIVEDVLVEEEVVVDEPVVEKTPEPVTEIEEETHSEESEGWISRLSGGLSKSSSKLSQGITDVLTKKKLDADAVEALEEALIEADLGPKTAMMLAEEISKDRFGKDIDEEEIKQALADKIADILRPVAKPLDTSSLESGPRVILVCGVNGVGKTTTIGKLAHQIHVEEGKKIVMAAGDTFRAAALEQLQIWADRVGCSLVKKELGSDAAAVAYEAYAQAKEEGADILLIDTAGRLHNKTNLMDELEKIIRVLKKHDETIPHSTLLVLDSTTGQNAHSQLETFKEIANITGLIVTKLDGSAKGGVVVSLADAFKLPIHAVGVGEEIEDLQPFDPDEFAKSLVGL